MTNPISPDDSSIERGEEIYMGSCVDCHGEEGRGDGPAAARQDLKPADFNADYVKDLTDGELFHIVTNGVEGSAMTPWNFFDEEARWHLVNYIRSLQE
jgi:mono/diheme cytochrome c family protein